MASSNPFPVLTLLSRVLRVVGWLVVIVGIIYAVATGIIEPLLPGHGFHATDLIDFLSGIMIAIGGIGLVAYGETIGVAFAIEANTRKAAEVLSGGANTVGDRISEAARRMESQRTAHQGTVLTAPPSQVCVACGAPRKSGARFCHQCGQTFPS